MSEFLLLGSRPAALPAPGEASPGGVAHNVVALAAWHGWLRRWGLLRSFGLPPDPAGDVRACLIVRASGHTAAERLAAGWSRASGYQVILVPLSSRAEGRGPAR
jgi:hypothetical protein